ncbi:Lrp/AsnC family transcriptional regulator [Streptomyces sp. NPDC102360]|uniref:Lrp/AsnC family transcriptional regulator n=1 Tax=Streptomyces sp. NPDC102360 TaxID=3366160 RepID=UPI0038140E9A
MPDCCSLSASTPGPPPSRSPIRQASAATPSRLATLERTDALSSYERRVSPASLGYPLTAFITVQVVQRRLDEVAGALAAVDEVLQVSGLSGDSDLLVHVVATDAEDLYRTAGRILAIPGVERTTTSLVMRQLVDYRITPLLKKAAADRHRSAN